MKDIVKVALDVVNKNVQQFSIKDGSNAVVNALIEANNGKTTLDYEDIMSGRCYGLFALVKEIISTIDNDILENSEFFNEIVDFKNVAYGDLPVFEVETNDDFIVSRIAAGTQELQRQRLQPSTPITVQTEDYGIKFYAELSNLLSKRIDLEKFIERVGNSLARKKKEIAQISLQKHMETLSAPYKVTGNYDETKLLELVQHVESANGGKAVIVGTLTALAKVKTADVSEDAKKDKYNMGFYGKFYGRNMVEMSQFHIQGTDTFAMDNNTLYILSLDDKPVKLATEGEGIIFTGNPQTRKDLQQEFLYIDRFGVAIATNSKGGTYKMS